MSGEIHELSLMLGELKSDLKTLNRTVHENQESNTEEHRKVHDIVVATSESVRNLAKDVAEMKPLTKDYEREREQKKGARRFLKGAYALGGGGVVAAVNWLLEYFGGRPPPHP